MADLVIGAGMTIFFGALLIFAIRTGTMPSIVGTVDATDREQSAHWFWILATLNTLGFVAGIIGMTRGLLSL